VSYDLAVFDPNAAPLERNEFIEWFHQRTEWEDDLDYNNPENGTAPMQSWFRDMIVSFPPLNGPFSKEELPEDESTLADYSLDKALVYVAFAWSKADEAYAKCFELAQRHRLGFFNVSSNTSDVWLPGKDGQLFCAHQHDPA
jgi:hypothetical protein